MTTEAPLRDARGMPVQWNAPIFAHPGQSPQACAAAGMERALPLPPMPNLACHPAFRRTQRPGSICRDVTPETVGETSPVDRRLTAMEKAQQAEIARLNAEVLAMKRHLGLEPAAVEEKPKEVEPVAAVLSAEQRTDLMLAQAHASARRAEAAYRPVEYRQPGYGPQR
jgi:hypothetical protein